MCGRATYGADPTAVRMLLTSAQWSISWAATPSTTERQRSTVSRCSAGERLVGLGLQAERGVQVLAHQPVLELGRLAQQVRERLAILDDDGWFRRHSRGKLVPRRLFGRCEDVGRLLRSGFVGASISDGSQVDAAGIGRGRVRVCRLCVGWRSIRASPPLVAPGLGLAVTRTGRPATHFSIWAVSGPVCGPEAAQIAVWAGGRPDAPEPELHGHPPTNRFATACWRRKSTDEPEASDEFPAPGPSVLTWP